MADFGPDETPIYTRLQKEHRSKQALIEFWELFDLYNQAEREKYADE